MPSRNVQLAALTTLLVATVAFAFGLGYFLRDRTAESRTIQVPATGTAQPATTPSPGQDGDPNFGVLGEIYDVLERDFVDPSRLDPEGARSAAINGLLGTLNDPHSTYVDPETYRLSGDLSGSYEGIGASVDQRDNEIIIVQAFPGSPAEKSGIRPGDAILAVDGEATDGWTVAKAVSRIRGKRGTEVRLSVRHEDGQSEEIAIVRGEILFDTVGACPDAPNSQGGVSSQISFECPLADAEGAPVNDLAYIYISQYTENTPEELEAVLEKVKEGGYKGLVLDLRNNPGGLLQETVDVTDFFLTSGTILIEVGRSGQQKTWEADAETILSDDLPIVVLQNENSASGSEVMAAALKDNGRATIIGERSFGKGTVNHFVRLSDGGALYVSIARWLTPKGNQIEGVGIKPDIEVELTDEDIDLERDAVLFRAIEFLRTGR